MKATKKTAKKLSASQSFAVVSVTRAEIAEALNNAADNEDYNGNPKYKLKVRFTSTDPRLTDALCKEIAESLSDGAFCSDESYEYEHETYEGVLESLIDRKLA